MARASVSLRMPNPSANGSGEAYQYWNSAHSIATANTTPAVMPVGFRPPVSLSATSCCKASGAFSRSVVMASGSLEKAKKNGEDHFAMGIHTGPARRPVGIT